MDYKKIYDALITIRDACDKARKVHRCEECPMYTGDKCGVYHSHPFNWDVIPPEMKLMR